MKAAFPLLATTALALPTALWAQSTSGVEFYGHFNPAWQSVDDGAQTKDTFVDNSNANSRFGFNVTTDLGDTGNSVLFNFETGLGFRPSFAVSQNVTPDAWDLKKTDLRKFEAIFSTAQGTFYVGQGSMAGDGIAGSDFSDVGVVASSSISDVSGDFLFRDTGTGLLTGPSIFDVYQNFDGFRRLRLRYDTPQIGKLKFAIAYGTEVLFDDDQEHYDFAAYYGDTFGDIEMAAAAGYSNTTDGKTGSVAGSVAFLHGPTGLNLSLGAGAAESDESYGFARLGLKRDLLDWGSTAAAVDYYAGQDFDSPGSHSDMWGVSIVQRVDAANLELYAGYREYAFSDRSGNSYDDLTSVLIGARWSYNF